MRERRRERGILISEIPICTLIKPLGNSAEASLLQYNLIWEIGIRREVISDFGWLAALASACSKTLKGLSPGCSRVFDLVASDISCVTHTKTKPLTVMRRVYYPSEW